MAIAHQTEVLGAANTTTTNYDISITPAAAMNGVVVIIEQNAVTADQITSVTYGITTGAVPLSRAASPYGFATDTTEAGGIYIYWGGDSTIWPSGAQTVRIVKTVAATNTRAAVATMTVAAGKVVALDNGGTGTSASVANPSWTHASLVNNVMAYLGIHSGLATMTNTPATGWTLWPATTGFEDMGQQGRGWARLTSATNTAGSLGAGWTASTADDFVGCSISFKEADPPPAPPFDPPGLLQRSPRPSEQAQVAGPYAFTPPSTLLGG